MNRRTFTFTALFSWLCPWTKPQAPRTPWSDLADELFEEHGHYADFEAWSRWMQEEADRRGESNQVLPENILDCITLYDICLELAEGRIKP